jgi:hypothetical protein
MLIKQIIDVPGLRKKQALRGCTSGSSAGQVKGSDVKIKGYCVSPMRNPLLIDGVYEVIDEST